MTGLSQRQIDQLLKPVNPVRVKKLDGLSHMESYDIRAHLNRVFGFAMWSEDLIDLTALYEKETTTKAGKAAFKVGYRATVRLTILATGASYTEAAAGEALMPDFKRGDAHDMAMKTAESQALKRCAINLGDNFGLSLYDQGSLAPLVRAVLYPEPAGESEAAA